MSEKRYTDAEIRELIIMAYGSIENYANKLNTTPKNIYDKIGRQTTKFLKELKDNGVTINQGIQIGTMGANNNKGTMNVGTRNDSLELKNEIEKLKSEIESLKGRLQDKDEIIRLLKIKL